QAGTQAPSSGASSSASVQRALSLAEKGRCKEALPVLKRDTPRLPDKQLRYHAAMGEARCAMSLEDSATTLDALALLQRDFPDDPEVLYVSAHYFSEIANRFSDKANVAAQHLAQSAPQS